MAITVASALELEVLRGGLPEVVAGARSLDRRIRWAHAAEVPNIAALLRGGELVLTTGVRLPSGEAGIARFVSELADRDAVRRELPGAPERVAVAVPASGGRLLALAVDGPLSAIAPAALERAAGLVALSTRQSRQEEILAARARGDLLARLLQGGL